MRTARCLVLALALVLPTRALAEPSDVTLAGAREAGDDVLAAEIAGAIAARTTGRERGIALLLRGAALARLGRLDVAETTLVDAASLLPDLADRITLARGETLLRAKRTEEAAARFAEARKNAAIDLVAMRSELGEVRALLALAGPKAVPRATQLLARYPELPEKAEIELGMARALEERGAVSAAVARYRQLWLENPHLVAGVRAGERLDELARAGIRTGSVKQTDQLDRVRRLSGERDLDRAEEAIKELLGDARGAVKSQLELELAIVAYRRSDFERALELLEDLRTRREPTGPWIERSQVASGDVGPAVRRILGNRAPTSATPPGKLVGAAQIYLDAGMYADAQRMLSFMKTRGATGYLARWLPWIAFKLGNNDDAIPGFSKLHEEEWSRGRRAYWVGRAHHEAGRPCEARAAYEDAIARAPHGYYGLWARQRLRDLATEVAARREKGSAGPLRCPSPTTDDPAATAVWTEPDLLSGWAIGPRRQKAPTEAETLAGFETLITAHGAALPWLARARDLWRAGDDEAAGEELEQAWWVTRGFPAPKTGLTQLWGGRPSVRRPGKGGAARFDESQRAVFVRIALAVGETGLALRAVRPAWTDIEGWHPVAYEREVGTAARRHELDPLLLMSIMRVESHFDRHAMSYANAIGLMQILPRTGRRVAALSGRDEFQVADLLRASDGIDLSAWYVRALSDRFHGQAPLVVAAYNGGPHNVASWILRRADRDRPLPMDELLEEIPFTETHRYVRRVLGSYAVYTALAGLPPSALPEDVDRDVASGVGF
jgi:soluble lytic murein transglycosylase